MYVIQRMKISIMRAQHHQPAVYSVCQSVSTTEDLEGHVPYASLPRRALSALPAVPVPLPIAPASVMHQPSTRVKKIV